MSKFSIFQKSIFVILRYVKQDPGIYFSEKISNYIEFVCWKLLISGPFP